jgi:glycosyltransferase involved in cell wall biosynthesis
VGPVAIVPAHNEEPTVAIVVATLLESGCFRYVLVVDDGSKDQTAERARAVGAKVMSLSPNRGKGEAMLAAVSEVEGDVAFFDADLVGLRPDHCQRLERLYNLGYDMVCGLRDYSGMRNVIQAVGPLITGERFLRRWVLEDLPPTCWRGYSIETAMNDVVTRGGGRTALMLMDDVGIRTKLDKKGWLAGAMGQLAMAAEIMRTSRALENTDGLACEL